MKYEQYSYPEYGHLMEEMFMSSNSQVFTVGQNTTSRTATHSEYKKRRAKRNYTKAVFTCIIAIILTLAIVHNIESIKVAVGALENIFSRSSSEVQSNEAPARKVPAESEYIALLRALDEDAWRKMSLEEKRNILQTVADFECNNVMGIPVTEVVVEDLGKEGLVGQYHTSITIDSDYLSEAIFRDSLSVVLHEARHRYQYYLVDAMHAASEQNSSFGNMDIFRGATALEENIQDYKYSDTDSYAAYLSQPMEVDARSYADMRIAEYYSQVLTINQYRGDLVRN
jgi:hypothetical protein